MPVINRSERQTTVNARPLPYDTGDTGAIGRGISSIGAALGKLGDEASEQEMFDAKMKVSEYTFREQMAQDQAIADYKPENGPADQFGATYEQERAARDQEFVGQFKNPKTQQYAMMHTQQSRQAAALRTQNARQGFVKQENIGRTVAQLGRIAAEAVTGDPESVVEAHKGIEQTIEQVPGLSPSERNRLRAIASQTIWQSWLGKADEDQLRRGKDAYEKGVGEWSKQFQEERKPRAEAGGIENHGEHSTVKAGSGARFRVATPYAERFAGLIADLEAEGVEIKAEQSGGYAKRNIAGTNTPSRHSHGEAIDINWDENARGARGAIAKRLGPEKINEIAKRHGMTWGGNWRNPDDMHFEIDRSANPPPVARRGIVDAAGMRKPQAAAGLAGEEGDWGVTAPRQMIALPERARMGDHAINTFTGLVPAIDKRLAELENNRIARFTVEGWRTGQIPFNANDTESKKLYDRVYGELGLGPRVATGDPRAIMQVTEDAARANYMAKDAYEGVKGLFDSTDPAKKQLGYDTVLNLYDRNPNIFDVHGGDSDMLKEAEHYRLLRRTMDADAAVKRLIEEKLPDSKLRKTATKDEVDKAMKPYRDAATVHSQIAKDMADSFWSKWFFTGYGAIAGRPQTDLERKQRAEMIADYTEALRDELPRNGSLAEAQAAAISRFKHRYGISKLFGRETVMAFPPERFYTANPTDKDGPFAYIEREIKEQVGIYNTAADPNSIKLRPLPQRYWIDGKPSYEVIIKRKDNGLEEIVPGRYIPGDPNAGAKFKEEDAKARKPAPAAPQGPIDLVTPEGRKAATDQAVEKIPNKVPKGSAPHEILRGILRGGDVLPLDGTEKKPEDPLSAKARE